MTPAVSKSAETLPFSLRQPCEHEDWVSAKFVFFFCFFSMLWIQMSTASGESGWCHVWLCMSEQGLGWLIRAGGAGVGSKGDASKVLELFTFSAVCKNSWCFVWLARLPPSFCVNPLSPTSVLSWIACLPPKTLLILRGLWKIYNRWAVFEGHVASYYLFAEGFGWVAAGPNVPPTQSYACYIFHVSQMEIIINLIHH